MYEHTQLNGLMQCWWAGSSVWLVCLLTKHLWQTLTHSLSLVCLSFASGADSPSVASVKQEATKSHETKYNKIHLVEPPGHFINTLQSPLTFISTCSSISLVLIVVYSFSNLKKCHRQSVKTRIFVSLTKLRHHEMWAVGWDTERISSTNHRAKYPTNSARHLQTCFPHLPIFLFYYIFIF